MRHTIAPLLTLLLLAGCSRSPFAWTLDLAPPLATAGKPTAPNAGPSASLAPSGAPSTDGGSVIPATPGATPPATGSPAITPPPSAAPSVAPTFATGPEPTFAPLDPSASLPPASTYSEVEPAQQQAVEQAITADEAVKAYLPDELIHDGGVVLYRLAQLPQPGPGGPPLGQLAPQRPAWPTDWERKLGDKSGAQLVLRPRPCGPGEACSPDTKRVRAVVRFLQKGVFRHNGLEKPFGQLFARHLDFVVDGGKATLVAASPVSLESQGGRQNLEVRQVDLLRKVDPPIPPQVSVNGDDLTLPLNTPAFYGGDTMRVEVMLANPALAKPFLYASLPGVDPTKRVLLTDDGQGVDNQAGDGRFSGALPVPNKEQLLNVLVDVVDPATFLPDGRYRANSLLLSARVKVRELSGTR